MSRYLSPSDIQEIFGVKKTKAFELLKEYEEKGFEVIRLGKHTRRVSEEQFIQFLRGKS